MAHDSAASRSLPERISFPDEEVKILELWEQLDAFHKSLELSKDRKPFTFYDGPPFATGLPHHGHILAGTIKDTVTRYAHQTGHYVERRFGWDCHGLPVENEINKKLGVTTKEQVIEMGIDKYNAECRGIVQRYTSEWERVVKRIGRWIDCKNDYKTMEPWYMESVWNVFRTIFDKDLVYRGYKILPYSTACTTSLSNFEANLDYRDTPDPSVVINFPLVDDPDVAFLAWTTTPWTLPSNLALCIETLVGAVTFYAIWAVLTFILTLSDTAREARAWSLAGGVLCLVLEINVIYGGAQLPTYLFPMMTMHDFVTIMHSAFPPFLNGCRAIGGYFHHDLARENFALSIELLKSNQGPDGAFCGQAILLNMRQLQGEVASSARRRPESSKVVKADAIPAAARKRLKMEKHPAGSQSSQAAESDENSAAAEELRDIATPQSEVQSGGGLGIPRWAYAVGIYFALNYLFSD
uniref:isoleucine--tRNA ligase n=1 Tax=Phytophthora ramorum TaxID=164328 RepID=H3H763_PHYRM